MTFLQAVHNRSVDVVFVFFLEIDDVSVPNCHSAVMSSTVFFPEWTRSRKQKASAAKTFVAFRPVQTTLRICCDLRCKVVVVAILLSVLPVVLIALWNFDCKFQAMLVSVQF